MATVCPKDSIMPDKIAGLMRGIVIPRAVRHREAPVTREASSKDGSMFSKAGKVIIKMVAMPMGSPKTISDHTE